MHFLQSFQQLKCWSSLTYFSRWWLLVKSYSDRMSESLFHTLFVSQHTMAAFQ